MEILVTCLIGIAVSLVAIEFGAWAPRISNRLIEVAVHRLPKEERERYHEEWMAVLADMPSPMSKLINALSIFIYIRKTVLLCQVFNRISFKAYGLTFYLSERKGVVCFDGLEISAFGTPSELATHPRIASADRDYNEADEAILEMMWAAHYAFRRVGGDDCIRLMLEAVERVGDMKKDSSDAFTKAGGDDLIRLRVEATRRVGAVDMEANAPRPNCPRRGRRP